MTKISPALNTGQRTHAMPRPVSALPDSADAPERPRSLVARMFDWWMNGTFPSVEASQAARTRSQLARAAQAARSA